MAGRSVDKSVEGGKTAASRAPVVAALDQRERLLELGFARLDLRTPEEVAVRPSAGAAEKQG